MLISLPFTYYFGRCVALENLEVLPPAREWNTVNLLIIIPNMDQPVMFTFPFQFIHFPYTSKHDVKFLSR